MPLQNFTHAVNFTAEGNFTFGDGFAVGSGIRLPETFDFCRALCGVPSRLRGESGGVSRGETVQAEVRTAFAQGSFGLLVKPRVTKLGYFALIMREAVRPRRVVNDKRTPLSDKSLN